MKTALAVAMKEHPTLRARSFDISAAQSDVDVAAWQYWPTPVVGVAYPDKALIAGTDRVVQTVGLKQPLWTGGRLDAAMAYAQARKLTAVAIHEEARRDVAIELIQAWGDACVAHARLLVYEQSQAMHRKFLEQIQRRTQSGLSVQSDIALASSRMDAVNADLAAAKAALEAAKWRLYTMVNSPVSTLQKPVAVLQSVQMKEAIEDALKTDPSLKRLKSEHQEISAQVESSKSALWPDVNLSVTQRHGDVTGRVTQMAIGLESKWGAGLSTDSQVQAALRRLDAKQEDIEYRTRKLTEQVQSDLLMLEVTQERAAAFKQALSAANTVAESWDRQFAAGKKSWQDVMNAVRESTQTEIQFVEATNAATVFEWRLAVLTHGVDWLIQTVHP